MVRNTRVFYLLFTISTQSPVLYTNVACILFLMLIQHFRIYPHKKKINITLSKKRTRAPSSPSRDTTDPGYALAKEIRGNLKNPIEIFNFSHTQYTCSIIEVFLEIRARDRYWKPLYLPADGAECEDLPAQPAVFRTCH